MRPIKKYIYIKNKLYVSFGICEECLFFYWPVLTSPMTPFLGESTIGCLSFKIYI